MGREAAVGAPRRLGVGMAVLVLVAVPGVAWGHWSIVSQLTAAEPGRAFHLQLHYEILAGQANPDEALKVCFWLERHQGNRYAQITGRACQAVTLKPNDWRTLTYSVDALPGLEDRRAGRGLVPGQYRAIGLIQTDVSPLARFFFGAAQDRKVLPFQIE